MSVGGVCVGVLGTLVILNMGRDRAGRLGPYGALPYLLPSRGGWAFLGLNL